MARAAAARLGSARRSSDAPRGPSHGGSGRRRSARKRAPLSCRRRTLPSPPPFNPKPVKNHTQSAGGAGARPVLPGARPGRGPPRRRLRHARPRLARLVRPREQVARPLCHGGHQRPGGAPVRAGLGAWEGGVQGLGVQGGARALHARPPTHALTRPPPPPFAPPRSNVTAKAAYGPDFRYREALALGSWPAAFGMSVANALIGAVFAIGPLRALARRLLPAPGQGPSREMQVTGFWRCARRTAAEAQPHSRAAAQPHSRSVASLCCDPPCTRARRPPPNPLPPPPNPPNLPLPLNPPQARAVRHHVRHEPPAAARLPGRRPRPGLLVHLPHAAGGGAVPGAAGAPVAARDAPRAAPAAAAAPRCRRRRRRALPGCCRPPPACSLLRCRDPPLFCRCCRRRRPHSALNAQTLRRRRPPTPPNNDRRRSSRRPACPPAAP